MPKKTRQEKIIADLRRKLASTGSNLSPQALPSKPQPITNPQPITQLTSLTLPPTNHLPPTTYNPPQVAAYIKKDLTKTLILTILVISLELMLYFRG